MIPELIDTVAFGTGSFDDSILKRVPLSLTKGYAC
jgi:hypothetical protein